MVEIDTYFSFKTQSTFKLYIYGKITYTQTIILQLASFENLLALNSIQYVLRLLKLNQWGERKVNNTLPLKFNISESFE